MSDPNLVRFRAVVEAGLAQLEARRQEINDLNVFPVADGDTGDNMVLTLRAVLEEIDRLQPQGEHTIDEIGRGEIVDSVARAALLGARGNSGVILSQLIRGAAEELASRPGELVDPVLVGAAMARAADRAYASVRDPAEGTILTVVREMAHRIATELAHIPDTRLAPDASSADQDAAIAEVLERALETGEQSVKRGPELLAVLRDSGVVDAGGYALTVLFAGVVAALRGAEPPPLEHHAPARPSHPQHESSTYRYCTNFAVTGAGLEASGFIGQLEQLGDSVLVVGDRTTLKIHVHTDSPERATALFEPFGSVSHLDVGDMREQIVERSQRLLGGNGGAPDVQPCGALAVVIGDGLRELFEGLGAYALDSGATLNPSTYDLLAGIHAVPAEQVVVLPNSANVVMAAERAAELSDKAVSVVHSHSLQAGLAVAVAFDPTRDAAANAATMEQALTRVRTGAVALAARDDGEGRFSAGEAVGFVDEEIVSWGDPEAALQAVIDKLGADAELLTCIAGEGAPLELDRVRALVPDGVELDCSSGGQPSWWWLLSAE
ncbi:MAG TPA: DAK2 domain-containing protein [Solirubrobacteraceae bacterium]|nr:DAK2 domain-containing protein [Solirubrobacteraceae bacterium]